MCMGASRKVGAQVGKAAEVASASSRLQLAIDDGKVWGVDPCRVYVQGAGLMIDRV